jgi:hypothetical protein
MTIIYLSSRQLVLFSHLRDLKEGVITLDQVVEVMFGANDRDFSREMAIASVTAISKKLKGTDNFLERSSSLGRGQKGEYGFKVIGKFDVRGA